MLTKTQIRERLIAKPTTFKTRVNGHEYEVTKGSLTGKVVTLKSSNLPAIVLGTHLPDARKSFAFIIMMLDRTNHKYTASRSDFKVA